MYEEKKRIQMKYILTKTEFKNFVIPRKEMSYGDIEQKIFGKYNPCLDELKKILKPVEISFIEGHRISTISKEISNPICYKYIHTAYSQFQYHLQMAFKQTYITGGYDHYILFKLFSLRAAFVFWQSIIDKFAHIIIELDKDLTVKNLPEDQHIRNTLYEKLREALNKNKLCIKRREYSFKDMCNDTKHNQDCFSELIWRLQWNKEAKNYLEMEELFSEVFRVLPLNVAVLDKFFQNYKNRFPPARE